MPPNTTRSLILARSSQHRPADEQHESVAVGLRRLCAAEPYRQARQFIAAGSVGIGRNRVFVDQLFDAKSRNFAATPAAAGEGRDENRAIPDVDETVTGACFKRAARISAVTAFLLLRPRTGLARTASLIALCRPRGCKISAQTAPLNHVEQLDSRQRTVHGAYGRLLPATVPPPSARP